MTVCGAARGVAAHIDRVKDAWSEKDLKDCAHDGFAFAPRSGVEWRLEIVAIGILRQKPAGDDAIDDSAIGRRVDEFARCEYPDEIRQETAKAPGGQLAAPSRIRSFAGQCRDNGTLKGDDQRFG